MIWLKKDNKITGNIVVGDKKTLQKLCNELTRNDAYTKLTWASIGWAEDLPATTKNLSELEYNNSIGTSGRVYFRKRNANPKAISTMIVNEGLKDESLQRQTNLQLLSMMGGNLKQMAYIENLCNTLGQSHILGETLPEHDRETLKYVIENLWEDFNFFAHQVLDVVEFQPQVTLVNGCGASEHYEDTAEANTQVLQLAKTIRKIY